MKTKSTKPPALTDIDLYVKYCVPYNASSSVFTLIVRSIDDSLMHLMDLEQIEKECANYCQAVRLVKRMKEYPLVSFDEDKNKFKVEKHLFSTLEEAIKASTMKAML